MVGTPFADTIAGDAQPNALYGGSGIGNMGGVTATQGDRGIAAELTLPPLATIWLQLEAD